MKLAFLKALTFTNIYKRHSRIVAAQNRAVKLIVAAASDQANTVPVSAKYGLFNVIVLKWSIDLSRHENVYIPLL